MKPTKSLLITAFIAADILFLSLPSLAQNTQVKWSSVGSGYGVSSSASSGVTSAIGGLFTGTSESGTSTIMSGFLAYSATSFVTDIADKQEVTPTKFSLSQNYPNPFNPATIIKYQIPEFPLLRGAGGVLVNLKVYNLLGEEVAILVNEEKTPGYYQVRFDGDNLSTGVYIYRLTAGNFVSTKKMLMIK